MIAPTGHPEGGATTTSLRPVIEAERLGLIHNQPKVRSLNQHAHNQYV